MRLATLVGLLVICGLPGNQDSDWKAVAREWEAVAKLWERNARAAKAVSDRWEHASNQWEKLYRNNCTREAGRQ